MARSQHTKIFPFSIETYATLHGSSMRTGKQRSVGSAQACLHHQTANTDSETSMKAKYQSHHNRKITFCFLLAETPTVATNMLPEKKNEMRNKRRIKLVALCSKNSSAIISISCPLPCNRGGKRLLKPYHYFINDFCAFHTDNS